MELTFIGAAHEVTGSCHYLSVAGRHLLVDCGMEQGANVYKNAPLPVPAREIDYVFLTHAHIDHSGMLPGLHRDGFRGKVIATAATADLCGIMLRDSAHIQMAEAQWKNRKGKRAVDGSPVEPLYTMEDTLRLLRRIRSYAYDEVYELCEGISFRFTDIGHLLGSASIELWLTENGQTRKIVFSGDIGNKNQPLLRDPQPTREADYVVMESTYGDRLHAIGQGIIEEETYVTQLAQIIRGTLLGGGNVVIPSFAVGRTQEILYFIRRIKEEHRIPELPDFPVYVDSPLAVDATQIFMENESECYDEAAMALVSRGINPLLSPNLHLTISVEESKAINSDAEPKVIIAASGMCDAGRVRHHLKYNLWRPECTVLFVGYQAAGTPGRAIVDGAQEIRIFGEKIAVRAQIRTLEGLSGHADQKGLLEWIGAFDAKPRHVFVVHGEDTVTESFAACLRERGYRADAPFSGTRYDLLRGVFAEVTGGIPAPGRKAAERGALRPAYVGLRSTGKELEIFLARCEGLPNKELEALRADLEALMEKYRINA
ncbi:MAG: MBL fold metallo-hydrolase [Eubacteriales bacterium]|nr:MBL fold metallo-hydrolase [Eubacteriales bacterium]